MMMMFLNQYLFGGIVASILGLLVLVSQLNRERRKKKGNAVDEIGDLVTEPQQGGGGSHDGPDVIVVGAGVAGSALAYTLGKAVCQLAARRRSVLDTPAEHQIPFRYICLALSHDRSERAASESKLKEKGEKKEEERGRRASSFQKKRGDDDDVGPR